MLPSIFTERFSQRMPSCLTHHSSPRTRTLQRSTPVSTGRRCHERDQPLTPQVRKSRRTVLCPHGVVQNRSADTRLDTDGDRHNADMASDHHHGAIGHFRELRLPLQHSSCIIVERPTSVSRSKRSRKDCKQIGPAAESTQEGFQGGGQAADISAGPCRGRAAQSQPIH